MVESSVLSRTSITLLTRAAIALAFTLTGVGAFAQSPPRDPELSSPFALEKLSAALQSAASPSDTHEVDDRSLMPMRSMKGHDRAFNFVLGSFFTAASSDLAVSMFQIGRGTARERGFGSWWQDEPVVFATSKSAMAAMFVYGLQRLHKNRPKTALVMGAVATAAEGWLVMWNARVNNAVP